MTYQPIPEGSVEVQTGLWLHSYDKTILGTVYHFRDLYSAEGYCFYNLGVPENFDEEGNLKPADERLYATYCSLGVGADDDWINANTISVPYIPGYEIVSTPVNTPVTE